MEGNTKGVLSHLSELERRARSRKDAKPLPPQGDRLKELKATMEALVVQRDQLKANIDAHKNLRTSTLGRNTHGEMEEEDSELLMARRTQLKDLLLSHHLIGGYDVIKTRQGKGLCVSLATAYEGVYLDTYHLEIDLKTTLKISRHDVPPFIPLESLAQHNMQTDITAFLHTLSQHLNAFAGRKQQLKLLKEKLHKSVEVLESNALCSILVLEFTVTKEIRVLCKLEYSDHTLCLPTRVSIECADEELARSQVKKVQLPLRLKTTPVHQVLISMKNMGKIG